VLDLERNERGRCEMIFERRGKKRGETRECEREQGRGTRGR
jgi:hypothetical protein